MIALRPRDQQVWDPRPLPHETEAETKTNYCETETETETKKTSLLFAAAKCHVTSFKRFMKQIKRLKKFDRKLRCSAAGVYVAESIKMSARMEQFYHSFLCPCTGSYCTAAVQPVAHLINYVFGLFYLFTYFSTLW